MDDFFPRLPLDPGKSSPRPSRADLWLLWRFKKKAPQGVRGLGVFTRGIRVLPSKPLEYRCRAMAKCYKLYRFKSLTEEVASIAASIAL